MKFALLGDHPDGLSMARALVESGRHELTAYCGSAVGAEYLKLWGVSAQRIGDAEEVLADPAIEAVIVAGSPADRSAQLRRAVQSDRPVLCVHPSDDNPNAAYEASMTQAETRKLLMPLLPEALHPAISRLAVVAGQPKLVDFFRASPDPGLQETDDEGFEPAIPGWDVLRKLGGEIVEVSGLAEGEELNADAPALISGRFEKGGMFRLTLLPQQPERWEISVLSATGTAKLAFPEGWPGRCELTWMVDSIAKAETWEAWNPWSGLVEVLERSQPPHPDPLPLSTGGEGEVHPTWNDEIRSLELDLAARRSIERRRTSTLEYQEATEEASFKGTMTLVGCSLLWISLVLLIISAWVPLLAWAIAPVFAVFLLLQLLRWIVPAKPEAKAPPTEPVTDTQSSSLRSAIRSRK